MGFRVVQMFFHGSSATILMVIIGEKKANR
jgi:hypothetical protein